MSKKSVSEAIEKVKSMIKGNDTISVKSQSQMLKELEYVVKHSKVSEPKQRKITGESQFQKKTKVSPEIAHFAEWDPESEHSRIEITKAIWDYVTKHNLRDEQNKRHCNLNSELKKLLKTEEEKITYPQLQKYVTQHQIK